MQKITTDRTKQKNETREGVCQATRTQIRRRAGRERITVGLDLGDRNSAYCVLSEAGEILLESTLPTTKAGLGQVFEGMPQCRIALEVGTHSPWVSRYLASVGHEVIVANPRQFAMISQSTRKNDRHDARTLAMTARFDVRLLRPIQHRSEELQADLCVLQSRDLAVRQRCKIMGTVRGKVKALGERLKPCAPEAAGVHLVEGMRPEIQNFAKPLLQIVEQVNATVTAYDEQIAAMESRYPAVELLKQVYGVGRLIALAFVLTLGDPHRFTQSRDVGPYLGLRPKQRDSGESRPQLGISKEGDKMLRWLLVQAAHTMLRSNAPDCDLRRWGVGMLSQAERDKQRRGHKRGCKKKVVVAVARKLAVLLHHLWVSGEVYDPLYKARQEQANARQAAARKVA
jgi:transposase